MILITGANGLVGSYLARYLLLNGETIRAIKRPNSDLGLVRDIEHQIEWVNGDILDTYSLEDAMAGIDKVYHTAACISYLEKERAKLIQVNAIGTANVVNTAMHQNIKKLLYVSSIAAIGRKGNGELIQEENEFEFSKTISGYALSKLLAEREVWRGAAEGLTTIIINPSIIVGAGNWNNGSSKLFTTINNGFKFYTEGITGFVDVRDVVKIAYQLMESSVDTERFIVSAENILYRDYFFMIADALNKKRPSIKASKFLSGLAWRADALNYKITGKVPSVTKATAQIANSKFQFDHTKIKTALHYQFNPIADTIQECARLFKETKKTNELQHLQF